MGEKEEKKSEGEKKSDGEKKAADGGGKKDDGPATIVLKLDLHCDGCANKVKRFIRNYDGVEDVKVDRGSNKVTVKGNVDPSWLREKVEQKTKKKVELVSPLPKKDAGGGGGDKKSDDRKPDEKKKDEDKKPKLAQVSTVVLKIRLHCDGCAHKIKRIIKKFDGVEDVSMDMEKDLVTVKGTMDLKDLSSYLNGRLRKNVDVVPPKKDGGGGGGGGNGGEKKETYQKEEKKDQDKEKDKAKDQKEENKEKNNKDGGGEKKNVDSNVTGGGAGGGGGEGDKEKVKGDEPKTEVNKFEYNGYSIGDAYYHGIPMYNRNYTNQDYGAHTVYNNHSYMIVEYQQPVPEYHHQHVPPPPPPPPPPIYLRTHDQMFSDENPNGCFVM